MKANRLLLFAASLITALIIILSGCEYDVTEPPWYDDFEFGPTPVISQVEPNAAVPGVNTITISGTNLAGVRNDGVYFDAFTAEILQKTATSIIVRRPNYVADSAIIKLVADSAIGAVKYSQPFRIDPVLEQFGSFLDNYLLTTAVVDDAENLYVTKATTTGSGKVVFRVTPEGVRDSVAEAGGGPDPTDARISPNGRLFLPRTNSNIDIINLQTGESERIRVPSGNRAAYGDFDAEGYFYVGGRTGDLVIVYPNPEDTMIADLGFYVDEEILGVRFFNGALYVLSISESQSAPIIWRHSVSSGGNLGTKESILDISTLGEFASRTVTSFAVTSTGIIFLGTDSPNDPILIFDPVSNSIDFFYKNILPPYCKFFTWGEGNYLYMISGNDNPPQDWTVYRIDMGTTVTP